MQSVGTRLREARIKKGYTLEEINARTRISLKNLTAIESDDLSKISSPFTYRSFVKQVADTVGVDHTSVLEDAVTASSAMPEPLVPGQEDDLYMRPYQYQPVKPKTSWNWLRMTSVAAAVGVVSIYLIWRNGGIEAARLPSKSLPASSRTLSPIARPEPLASAVVAPSDPPPTRSQAAVVVPVIVQSEQVKAAPEPPPAGTEQLLPPSQIPGGREVTAAIGPPSPPSASEDADGAAIHVELSAMESTWLSISSDGKNTYRGTLAAMQTKSFGGKDTARIRIANAGAVNVIFNGRALGPLGPRGQARTVVFTKSGYDVVQGVGALAHLTHTGG